MNLADIQTAMVNTFKERLPGLKTCKVYTGQFDADSLTCMNSPTPALYLTQLSVGQPEKTCSVYAPLEWGVSIVTKDSELADANSQALNLMQAVNVILADQDWGMAESRTTPEQVTSQSLFSTRLACTGIAIWSVTWTQSFELSAGLDWEALNAFLLAVGETELGDHTAVTTTLTLPGASE